MSDFHVGILALDVYFPSTYVSQEDLEVQNNCKGKYTVGLGQDSMAFCGDREDINSISLTVVNSLLTKYKIPKSMIGRIEIGTESLIDKSKSTKTVIMDLFAESGNTDIEGVTVVNACYGGTAALLNTLCWVDSSSWDGRYGLVIAADIAVYSDGPARPTGGCGAVAMLIGRNAPLPVNLRTRTCYSTHVWDFFKPKMSSEYPEVNGALSQTCYLKALDDCYTRFLAKQTKLDTAADKLAYGLSTIDEFLFHSPYNKLVQKSFNRLVYLDMMAGRLPNDAVEKWRHVPIESTYEDKELESKMKDTAGPLYAAKVADGCTLSKQIGNTYTASLYMNLSCIVSLKGASLLGKRLTLFSYGSGAMASMFEINPRETYSEFTLQRIQEALSVTARLADRQKMTPEDLTRALEIREHSHGLAPYHPYCTTEGLYPGTYYLEEINSLYERLYRVKSIESLRVPGPMVDPVKVTNGAKTAVTAEKKNIKGPPPLAVGGNSTDYLPSQALDALIEGAEENGDDTNTDYSGGISIDHNDGWRSVEGDNPNPSSDIRRRFSAKGMPRVQTMVWASGKLNVKVVVTGVAAALPGRDKPLVIESGSKNIQRVIQGENFITPIPDHVKDAMLEKNVVEMIKNKDGVLEKRSISTHQDNINLCAAIGTFNLNDYGVSDSIASTMDKSVQVSIIAGLEALKHSGLVSGVGPKGWELPESMQNTTGVVFATSFPALDTAIAEVSRYYTSKQLHSQNLPVVIALLREKLRGQLDGGVLSSEVESAVKLLEEEIIRLGALQRDGTEKVKPYEFDRKFLFRVLVLGNAQLAQIIKAKGPNMQTNAACAGATQAIALGYDMIQTGRAERVVVIAGDNASSDTLMPWLGNGFRALGAANINSDIKLAAIPFDSRRSGMILGSGGIGIVLESEDGARRRYSMSSVSPNLHSGPFCCRLLGTLISNSAYHGASMDKMHIASEMERFVSSMEREQLIPRRELAMHGVYFSHETSTHASATSSCSYNELYGLRKVFGDDFKHLLILNTKGFTGHPMGVSFEDVVAAEVLMSGLVPPVANFSQTDPALGEDIRISRGGEYRCKYALRFAAGFGSQVALALYGAADI